MKIKKLTAICCLLLFFTTYSYTYCQNKPITREQTSDKYYEALNMFQLQDYTCAMKLFSELYSNDNAITYNEKSNTLYYLAVCNKLVGDQNLAELYFNSFLQNYPENLHNNEAMFALGQIQFKNKSYKIALETFQKIKPYKLDNNLLDEYYFKIGYCYLKNNMTEDAKYAFSQAKNANSSSTYGNAAIYYYACIAYDEKKYDDALVEFEKLTDDNEFEQPALQYIIRIYSIQGKYDKIVDLYKDYSESTNKKDNNENIRLFANAFYKTDNPQKAIELYEDITNSLSPEDYYQLGYSYFNLEKYTKALPCFENASKSQDSLGQNALYHVGLCDLKTGNKDFAASAFKDAYKLNIDKVITECALFNYVKIAYETGFDPYNGAISSLQEYIDNNPNSKRIDEAYSYLAKLFISTKNYQSALDFIDKLNVKTPELKTAYQKINYSGGIENFNNKKYTNAISLFEKSNKYPQDMVMQADATYWTGECYYRQQKYDKAIIEYLKFFNFPSSRKSSSYNPAYYSLGYCYFKNKNYSAAQNAFNQYIKSDKSTNVQMMCDALNRIGDCNFINHKYLDAVNTYNQAIQYNGNRNDYSLYYKAMALGAMNNLKEKANSLQTITKMPHNTILRSNAMYELGNTYLLVNDNNKALEEYKQLIAEYPKAGITVKAKQKLGMLYYNLNDNDNAIACLKDVVTKYPGTKEASECLASLKNIYVEKNNVDDYFNFVNNTAHISTSATEADSLSFESAQRLYMSEKYDKAKEAFLSYIKKYPSGAYKYDSYYYIGECYSYEKNYDDALEYYTSAYESNTSIYAENAKMKAAKILQINEDYKTAAQLYSEIIKNTEYDYITDEANIELMRCYFNIPEYEKLKSLSEIVMNNSSTNEDVISEAKYYHAQAIYHLGSFDEAYKEFSKIASGNFGEKSAEAKYYCCYIKYMNSKTKEAETETFELIKNYSSYDYWVAKGFILLADIYVKENNTFQARQTLQSIIDNYNGEDLKQDAQNKLNKLNKNE